MTKLVVRNASLLTLSSVLQKLISFAYFTIIARLIGVGNTGQYFFAISFTTIFTVIADFGLGSVLVREGARNPTKLSEYVSAVFSTKLLFGFVAYGGVILVSFLLNYSSDLRLLIALSGITMFFDNLQTAFYSAFRSQQNLVFEAGGNIGAQVLTLIIGTISLLLHAPLYWLILAYTIPSGLVALYASIMLRKVYKITPKLFFTFSFLKPLLAIAVPFALAGIIGRLYSYADLVIMSKMLKPHDIGWWSVPYKIVYAFQFIPAALSASLYPAFSAMYINSKDEMGSLYIKSLRYLALFSVPVATGLFVLAEPIILWLYGSDYLNSVIILKVLSISLLFTYTSLLTGALLNACNRQKTQTFLMATALVINVVMNLVLIPAEGIFGAALSALFTSLLLMLGSFFMAESVLKVSWFVYIFQFAKFFIPVLVMTFSLLILKNYVHVVVNIVLGGAVYMAVALASNLINIGEIKQALGVSTNKL